MKCYVAPIPASLSRGIHRVADALAKFAPADVQIVDHQADADLLVCHVIGPEGWTEHLFEVAKRDKRYAIFQYCLKTTSWPWCESWLPFWEGAEVVASYYPLQRMTESEREVGGPAQVNFLHLPLGVDTTIFRPDPFLAKEYIVGTSGYVDGMEIISGWAKAIAGTGGRMFHLGPPSLKIPHAPVTYRLGEPDSAVAMYWAACRYVSGLRRTEGFELPALEGLACGARPVMFDRQDARQWFGDHAEYIQEGSDEEVVRQLDQLLRRPYRPVTEEEITWVHETFQWKAMAERFWGAIRREGALAPSSPPASPSEASKSASPPPSSGSPKRSKRVR